MLEEGRAVTHGVAPFGVNYSHGPRVQSLLPLGLSLTAVAATPRELLSSRRDRPERIPSHRRVYAPFRLSLIGTHYLLGHSRWSCKTT